MRSITTSGSDEWAMIVAEVGNGASNRASSVTGVTEFYDLWLDPYQLKSQHNANEYATVRIALFA